MPAQTSGLRKASERILRRALLIVCVGFGLKLSAAQDQSSARGLALFNDYIGPLFKQNCYECHSHEAEKVKGGLVLDSRNGWAKGGEHGPAIMPGEPDKSLLLRAVSHTDADLQMPPKKKLSDDLISKIRDWIALGAPDPRTNDAPSIAPRSPRSHWAFQPVRRPPIPSRTQRRGEGTRNPIDAFIVAKLANRETSLAPEADRRTLIRRLSFDLRGLAPSPEEIAAFVADRDPRAYEKLVDRFLDSPHYGERWGRHWLDVAGFAESSLFIGDQVRPGFWRYRDYVIRAFNSDKPYNRFVMEQVAGDELFDWRSVEAFTHEQIDVLAATGFLRCPPDATDNQAITQQEKVYPAQQQAMEVSMKAIMGLTLNCVRCHSHKYDPIPHEDYYGLIAIFQAAYDPAQWLPGIWSDPHPGPIRAIPILPRAAREDYDRDSRAWPGELHELGEQTRGGLLRRWRDPDLMKRAGEIADDSLREKLLALLNKASKDRTPDDEKFIAAEAEKLGLNLGALQTKYPEFSNTLASAQARLDKIKAEGKKLPPVIWATFDVSTNPSPARLLRRGDYEQPAIEVQPGVLSSLDDDHSFQIAAAPYPGTTGRRLALARWLTRRDHPLTARVMVNRIWQYHFGSGLVATPDDFGTRGAPPTHPELLDWLAAEFMDHNWSIKHIHRLILNSATYRQSSTPEDFVRLNAKSRTRTRARDEDDAPLRSRSAAAPLRRLEAEVVRDTMLQVSGQLDLRLFGESIPTLRLADGRCAVATNSSNRNRRSVYISTRRTTVPTFLTAFDEPTMDTNWPKRNDSVIPQQALALMNNEFVQSCSEEFARRVLRESRSRFEDRLDRAFLLAYGRSPQPDEQTMFKKFCATPSKEPDDEKLWTTICHALLSSNEFLYVD